MSTATVSYAINNDPRVKPATARVVRQAVEELGYVAQQRTRRRARRVGENGSRRTNRIAMLAAGIPRAALNSSVYVDVLHGVEAAVAEAGLVMMLRQFSPTAPGAADLFPQKVDGVLLFGFVEDERLTRRLQTLPCVQMMRQIEPQDHWDHVSYKNNLIGQIAAQHLLARGHRHTACVGLSERHFLEERGAVFQETITAAGGTCLNLVEPGLLTETGVVQQVAPECLQRVVDHLLAAQPRPTAVFLVVDTVAPAFYNEFRRRGLQPGRDLDVISCNNEQQLLAHLHPRPATIDIHAERVGRKAVEQLLWRIEHPDEPRVTVALEPTLVAGGEAIEP